MGKKSLIKEKIGALLIAGGVTLISAGIGTTFYASDKLNNINDAIEAEYQQLDGEQDFINEQAKEKELCKSRYANNEITLEELNTRLKYIDSRKYKDSYMLRNIDTYQNSINKIEDLQSKTGKFSGYLPAGIAVASVTGGMLVAEGIMTCKRQKNLKREQEQIDLD